MISSSWLHYAKQASYQAARANENWNTNKNNQRFSTICVKVLPLSLIPIIIFEWFVKKKSYIWHCNLYIIDIHAHAQFPYLVTTIVKYENGECACMTIEIKHDTQGLCLDINH